MSLARDGSNYDRVLCNKKDQLIGQVRFTPNNDDADGHKDEDILDKVPGGGGEVSGVAVYGNLFQLVYLIRTIGVRFEGFFGHFGDVH